MMNFAAWFGSLLGGKPIHRGCRDLFLVAIFLPLMGHDGRILLS